MQVRLKQWTTTTPAPVLEEYYSLFRRYPGESPSAINGIAPWEKDIETPTTVQSSVRTVVGRSTGKSEVGGFEPSNMRWWRKQVNFVNTPTAYLALAASFGLIMLLVLVYILLTYLLSSRKTNHTDSNSLGGSIFEEDEPIGELGNWRTHEPIPNGNADFSSEMDKLYRNIGRDNGSTFFLQPHSRAPSISDESTLRAKYSKRTPLYSPLPPPPPNVPPPPAPQEQSRMSRREPPSSMVPLPMRSRNGSYNASENIYSNSHAGDLSRQSSLRRDIRVRRDDPQLLDYRLHRGSNASAFSISRERP